MKYASGGVVSGPDPTPIYTETMLALSRWDGYVISARVANQLGGCNSEFLKRLNEVSPPT